MNQIAAIQPPQRSVTMDMAHRFGMEPNAFEQTLRATVFPGNGSREQFTAYLLVAREYNLNPITKEIYALPAKGGGIIPVVSIDGWLRIINSHPQFDGMEFESDHDDKGDLFATKCTLWRKDRSKPIIVTEYLSECIRPTEPWKMKHRMLRHKALIQTARYAFGFSGIYDPDEAERIAEAQAARGGNGNTPQMTAIDRRPPSPERRTLTPPNPNRPASAPPKPVQTPFDYDAFRSALMTAKNQDEANAIFDRDVERRNPPLTADEADEAQAILREVCQKFWTENEDVYS